MVAYLQRCSTNIHGLQVIENREIEYEREKVQKNTIPYRGGDVWMPEVSSVTLVHISTSTMCQLLPANEDQMQMALEFCKAMGHLP